MRQAILSTLTLSAVLILLFPSCKKEEINNQAEKMQFSLVKNHVLPQELVILTANQPVAKDTCSIRIDGRLLLLSKIDSFSYGFLMPVFSSGNYTIDLSLLNAYDIEVTVDPYATIINADDEIKVQENRYYQLIDSLENDDFRNVVTTDDIAFLKQVVQQIDKNYRQCSESERMLIAYQLRNSNLVSTSSERIDTVYLTAKATQNYAVDPSSILWNKAKTTAFWVTSSIITARTTYVTARLIETPYGAASFLVSMFACGYSIKSAFSNLSELGSIIGIAMGLNSDLNGYGSSTNPINAINGETVSHEINANYRTVSTSDAQGLNEDINTVIKGAEKLQEEDSKLKQKFDALKSTLSDLFGEIKAAYQPYVSPITSAYKTKTLSAFSKNISIENVSDSKISVAITDDGNNGFRLTVTNPDKSIKANLPFSAKIVYNQPDINNSVSVTEYFVYRTTSDTTVKVTTSGISALSPTSVTCGGVAINDGGNPITQRGVCWNTSPTPTITGSFTNDGGGKGSFTSNVVGLTPSTTYYIRSYVINSSGTTYGNEISFITQPSLTGRYTLYKLRQCAVPGPVTFGSTSNYISSGTLDFTSSSFTMYFYSGSSVYNQQSGATFTIGQYSADSIFYIYSGTPSGYGYNTSHGFGYAFPPGFDLTAPFVGRISVDGKYIWYEYLGDSYWVK